MSQRLPAPNRQDFFVFRTVPTRWMDNDVYGHVNNVVYYSWFDTVVNGYLIEATGIDIRKLEHIGVVAETSCRFFESVSFPQSLDVGLAVERLGTRSITYRLGVFGQHNQSAAALGSFVHVYVDATTRNTVPIPSIILKVVAPLVAGSKIY